MAEFPALPFWTDAYLADTRDLNAAQHGAYFLLLMTAWRTKENGLPDDDEKLARWAAMDKRTWLKNKRIVMSFWCKIDGLWHQKRLDDERKRAEHVRRSQVQAGLASALKRKETQSRHVATELPTPLQPPSPSPSPSTYIKKKLASYEKIETTKKEEIPKDWLQFGIDCGKTRDTVLDSWERFKDYMEKQKAFPFPRNRWEGWIKKERAEI